MDFDAAVAAGCGMKWYKVYYQSNNLTMWIYGIIIFGGYVTYKLHKKIEYIAVYTIFRDEAIFRYFSMSEENRSLSLALNEIFDETPTWTMLRLYRSIEHVEGLKGFHIATTLRQFESATFLKELRSWALANKKFLESSPEGTKLFTKLSKN